MYEIESLLSPQAVWSVEKTFQYFETDSRSQNRRKTSYKHGSTEDEYIQMIFERSF